ncbi:MAG: hypothetical protein Tsb009_24350 [Planctomycetaceae bacterium]
MSMQDDNSVYNIWIEIRPLPGCILNEEQVAGAFTRCYVRAGKFKEALSLLEDWLRENRFELVDILWMVNIYEAEWDNPDDPADVKLIEEARTTGNVVHGEYEAWEYDDEE